MNYHHVTETERYLIYALLKAGCSQKAIAAQLNRHPSTISREVRRNEGKRGYRPRQAQQKAAVRQTVSAANARCISIDTWQQIERWLREDWSPEQIAGRTRLASTERIYLHVYRDKAAGGDLWRHLRCRKRRRKRYASGRDRRGQIRDRVPISARPTIVNRKARLGDWEGDTVIGAGHCGVLVTLAERRSQLVRIRKVPSRQSAVIRDAMTMMFRPVMDCSHTLTLDNGKEFAAHKEVSKATGIAIYFADAYASWQRGLNEQINGLIRQYVPKSMSIHRIAHKDIEMIEKKLNNRPRKMLGYRTPLEVFNELAASQGVALRY